MTLFLTILSAVLLTILLVFYIRYRFDLAQLKRFMKRGDLKYLKRYAAFLHLKGMRDVFQNMALPKSVRRDDDIKSSTSVFDEFPSPILILDHDHILTYYNKRAKINFSLRKSNKGMPLINFMRIPLLYPAIDEVISSAEQEEIEVELPSPKNTKYTITLLPFSPGGKAKDAEHLILIFHDQSYFHRLEKMRSEFIANASHELKTPLSSIAGFIETLSTTAKDDPKARTQFLKIMGQQANHMSLLIDDLLSLSKIELEESQPPTSKVKIKNVLDQVIAHLTHDAEKRGIKIVFEKPKKAYTVIGDEKQLFQAFQNLIHNAIKYGYENSEIKVSVNEIDAKWDDQKLHPQIEIKIQDESEGIPQKHLVHLTERFYRIDKDRSKDLGGTGLGLSIVKHIIRRHRGDLFIESEMGKGSCFKIVLGC
jgi:two-component system phosphate regulon sensor histidine kinase PhoR